MKHSSDDQSHSVLPKAPAGSCGPGWASLPAFHHPQAADRESKDTDTCSSGLLACHGLSSGLLGGISAAVCGGPHSSGLLSSGILSSGVLCGEGLSSGLLGGIVHAPQSRVTHRPLSVCHLGPCLYRGGSEQHLIDLARFLDPKRAVMRECLVTDPQKIDPCVVRSLPCPVRAVNANEIDAALQQHDIVLHWGLELDQFASVGSQRKSVNIYLAHGDSQWTQELLVRSAKHTDHVIAVSHKVVDGWKPKTPTTVIPNGIDTARLATSRSRKDIRRELGFGCHDFVVGFVGRLSAEKRPELLIKAIAQLPPQFKALIVGWGDMQGSLMKLANDLIPNRYAFRFADSYLGDYYQAFDAFLLPSVFEGFGLVILEAMFMGLPVLATPVGVVPEAIESMISGIVIKPCPDDIAQKLSLLRANPDWSRGMGTAAQKWAHEFGYARRMADEYANLFEQLVRARHS